MRQPWELVADALRQAITDKKYRPGDQLPSENQLAAQHGASRPTIRRALQDLRLKGLIETRQGKGAFVRMPSPIAVTLTAANYQRHRQEGRPGFAAQMDEQGHTSRQDILEVGPVPAPSEVAQRLGIDEGAEVVMRRLRFVVDELPVQLVRVYYRPELAASIPSGCCWSGSMWPRRPGL
jgi:GntR family transcriptional regulator